MAKNSIRDYDATSGNNTDVQSVDISEGCAASGINNALREIMTDLKNVSTGAVALETPAADQLNVDNIRIDGNTISSTDTNGNITLDPNGTGDTIISSGNVGIGTNSPARTLTVDGSGGNRVASITHTAGAYAFVTFSDANTSNDGSVRVGALTNDLVMMSGGTENLRVDSSGLVGIGVVPSGTAKLQVNGQIYASQDGSASAPAFAVNDGDTGMFRPANNNLAFTTGGTERMRIDSGGKLYVGTTSGISNERFILAAGTSEGIRVTHTGGGTKYPVNFTLDGSGVGSISISSGGTSYNTSSDHRLKENVADMTGAIDRVKALAPKRFNFIADADKTVDGFLAHEAQTVVPEAVTGTHNEVDENGDAVMQGIDQSKLVPLLTGALQEAISKIETLETQRADLEARLTALENA